MTRDAGYLRGFVRLLEHLSSGGDLGHLLVGKLRLEDEPLVDDLTRRHVLSSPPLTPRFLTNPLGRRLLTGLRSGVDILELSAR